MILLHFYQVYRLAFVKKINSELGIALATDGDGDGTPSADVLIANIPTAAMNQDGGNTGIGAYAAGRVIAGDLTGHPFGCADFDNTAVTAGDLVYYHVLIER